MALKLLQLFLFWFANCLKNQQKNHQKLSDNLKFASCFTEIVYKSSSSETFKLCYVLNEEEPPTEH